MHAQDYLAYAYLQRGQQDAARRVVDEVAQRAFAAPAVLALVFGHALPPVRYAYERGRWDEAAALAPGQPADVPWDRFPQAEAVTHQARAIGAAPRRRPGRGARKPRPARGAARHAGGARDAYWAEQVDIWRAEAVAWIAHAEGQSADALQSMRWAADTEARTDKHIVWPGPLAPAREMLGELLLAVGEPAQALAEFEASLANEPDRLRGLYGAGLRLPSWRTTAPAPPATTAGCWRSPPRPRATGPSSPPRARLDADAVPARAAPAEFPAASAQVTARPAADRWRASGPGIAPSRWIGEGSDPATARAAVAAPAPALTLVRRPPPAPSLGATFATTDYAAGRHGGPPRPGPGPASGPGEGVSDVEDGPARDDPRGGRPHGPEHPARFRLQQREGVPGALLRLPEREREDAVVPGGHGEGADEARQPRGKAANSSSWARPPPGRRGS